MKFKRKVPVSVPFLFFNPSRSKTTNFKTNLNTSSLQTYGTHYQFYLIQQGTHMHTYNLNMQQMPKYSNIIL